jgi:hypothetical protein
MLRVRAHKIVFQHYLPGADIALVVQLTDDAGLQD